MKKTLAVLAVLVALPVVARAQKPVTQTDAIEVTTKIEAIDKTAPADHAEGPGRCDWRPSPAGPR